MPDSGGGRNRSETTAQILLFGPLEITLPAVFPPNASPVLRRSPDRTMKNAVVVGIICLVIGIAVGWVAKPGVGGDGDPAKVADAKPERRSVEDQDGGKLATKSGRAMEGGSDDEKADGPRSIVISNGEVIDQDGEGMEEVREMQDRWQKAMVDRQRKKFDARISKLVADLGLDGAQEEKLKKFFDDKIGEITEKMKSGDQDDFSGMKELAGLLRGEGLDDQFERILSAEQQEEYAAMKEKERMTKLDSKALKDMAKVNEVVSLRPEQKEAVYDLLYEDAEKSIDENKDATGFMSVFTEGMGIEIDTDVMGITEAIQVQMESAEEGGEAPDPNDWMKVVRESQKKRIDDQVERLAPVLDEQQLSQYRSHLETKSSGFLGGMMMGVEEEVKIEGMIEGPPVREEE